MSHTISSLPAQVPPRPRVFTRQTAIASLLAVAAAVIANVAVYAIGGALVPYHADFLALATAGPVVVFTLVAGIGAALVYVLVLRLSRRPARTFGLIAVIVFILTLIPDLTIVPSMPGATVGQTAVLLTMHVVAALVLVGVLTTRARPE